LTTILICVDGEGYIADATGCVEILVVDVDEKKVVNRIRVDGIRSIDDVEHYIEFYDPHLMFVAGIDEDLETDIEETGVHVYAAKRVKFSELLEELYGFTV